MHSHILPGVDDGAADMEVSVEMAVHAWEAGIRVIMATPHYIEGVYCASPEHNMNLIRQLTGELQKRNIAMEIYLGNEIFVTPDIPVLIQENKVAALNGSRYILLELPRSVGIPWYAESLIYKLRLGGIIPVIAHPERLQSFIEEPGRLAVFLDKGALAQLNLPSLTGRHGRRVRDTARLLLKANLVQLLGLDQHSPQITRAAYGKMLEQLLKNIPESKAYELLFANPQKVIFNDIISI